MGRIIRMRPGITLTPNRQRARSRDMWPSGEAWKLKSSRKPIMQRVLPVALLGLVLAGCDHRTTPATAQATAPTLSGDAAHPGKTSGWVDTKLYFGLGPTDQPEKGISETAWRAFLDKEVTTRFPDGL